MGLINYNEIDFVDETAPAISAANLMHMQQGIKDLDDAAAVAVARASAAEDAAAAAAGHAEGTVGLKGDPGDPGPQGEPGRSWTNRGGFQPNTLYHQLDVILEDGNTYVPFIEFTSGDTFDSANWQLFVERGRDGNDGPANTLEIGTVQKGTNASATITGAAPNQVLNLVLPKGDKGDKGDPGTGGGTGGGSADLSGIYGTMAVLLNEFARQDANARIDQMSRDAAADPNTPFVGSGQLRYFGQVGVPFELYVGGQVFGLYNFNNYPQDLTYSASAGTEDETYDELPDGLTISPDGAITGTPTTSTMGSPYRVSSTFITQTSASVPDANSTVLVELVIFPAS